MGLKKLASLLVTFSLAATLGGCAAVMTNQDGTPSDLQVTLQDLHDFVGKDLDAATARALKAVDVGAPYRARCYVTLRQYLPDPTKQSGVSEPVGVVDAFELAAETDAKLRAGGPLLPPEVEANCAYVIERIRKFAIRNAAKFAPVPGAATLAPMIGR